MPSIGITLQGVPVLQGNAKGKSIDVGSSDVLHTSDLFDCVAILIMDSKRCVMIHSDTNDNKGVGSTSLENAFNGFGFQKENQYTIGLIGGRSNLALLHKKAKIQELLPKATIDYLEPMQDSAYFLGNGVMAATKGAIKTALKVDSLAIDEPAPLPTHSARVSKP
jgi:hypothetical protein